MLFPINHAPVHLFTAKHLESLRYSLETGNDQQQPSQHGIRYFKIPVILDMAYCKHTLTFTTSIFQQFLVSCLFLDSVFLNCIFTDYQTLLPKFRQTGTASLYFGSLQRPKHQYNYHQNLLHCFPDLFYSLVFSVRFGFFSRASIGNGIIYRRESGRNVYVFCSTSVETTGNLRVIVFA
ncbi:unknown [Bacteroides sp. CAG:754]|nr:unknown [Bacteroides sp. CAG:754]